MIGDLFHSSGKDNLEYFRFKLGDPMDDQIQIKTKYCGICPSDISIYGGSFEPMPMGCFGHEGIGTVTKVGKNIKKVKNIQEGDFVATISDPAYSTYYYAKENEFVKIPELSPKYIIEPVACAMNIIRKAIDFSNTYDILIFGTGFMSMIIGQYCKNNRINLTVVGNSNKDIWKELGYDLYSHNDIITKKYPTVIDLSSKAENFERISFITEIEGLIVMASTPFTPITTNFFQNSWNCHTFIFPSPRNSDFKFIMEDTVGLIREGIINPEKLWTNKYSFTDAELGFKNGLNRTPDYIRGYIDYE